MASAILLAPAANERTSLDFARFGGPLNPRLKSLCNRLGARSTETMTKLPILDFKGLAVAVNPDHVLKIEERESKDGTPRCIIHFVDQSMLTWDGKLSALLPLLL